MKYWILTTEYPPFSSGGIGTYCFHTANMLSKYGYDVTIFIPALNFTEDKITYTNGYRIVEFCERNTESKFFLGYTAYVSYEFAAVIKQYCIKEGVPDIVESQEYNGIAYYLQQYKLLKYPVFKELVIIITCHAPSFVCLYYNHSPTHRFPSYWTGQMEIATIKSADAVISPSDYLVSEIGKFYKVNDIEIHHLLNPYEEEKELNLQEINSSDNDSIICFSKLSPLKGTFEILKYFKKLWDNGFTKPLTIIGGGALFFYPENTTMQLLINDKYDFYIKNGLLKFAGQLDQKHIHNLLKKAEVVIVPSLFDNLPYTVIESMSKGCLILASMQGGHREIIKNGINGFLFDHNISGDFEEKLNCTLNLKNEERIKIRKAASDTIERDFNYEKIFKQKSALLEKILHSPKTRNTFPFIETIPVTNNKYNVTFQSNNEDLLSVVIPFYNMGNFVEKTVLSIIESSYLPIEIIIVNDGSTEKQSLDIIEKIKAKYNIKVFHQSNEGLAVARNKGAELATGKFLSFLDPDDYVEAEYYSKAINILKTYQNVKFVGSWIKYFGNSNNTWPAFNPEFPYLLLHNMINSSSLVYIRESFMNYGLNDSKFIYGMEDWDSVISMVENGQRGVVLPETLFNYRIRSQSMSRKFNAEKKLFLYNLISQKHDKIFKKNATEIFNILNANGPGYEYDNPTLGIKKANNFIIKKMRDTKVAGLIKKNKTLLKVSLTIYRFFQK